MPLTFDATLKFLAQRYPRDWLGFLGQPAGDEVTILSPDLSTVSASTDIVYRTNDRVLHLDFQSGPDEALDRRLLVYNALIHRDTELPVDTVVVLTRPKADRSGFRDAVGYEGREGRCRTGFRFEVVRLWELPPDRFLTALGVMPLAPLGAVPAGMRRDEAMAAVFRGLVGRILAGEPGQRGRELLGAVSNLMMSYLDPERVRELFAEAHVEETMSGLDLMIEGELRALRSVILGIGTERFGEPSEEVRAAVLALDNFARADRMWRAALRVRSWEELLAVR